MQTKVTAVVPWSPHGGQARLRDDARGAPPADVAAALAALVDEYEDIGDWMITMLGREGADPDVRRMTDRGRGMHREWVRTVFVDRLPAHRAAAETLDLLVVATDLYTWKLLRRDRGLARAEVEQRMRVLVDAVLAPAAAAEHAD
jgi:hypothetical protein